MKLTTVRSLMVGVVLVSATLFAQTPAQTEQDAYTRIELGSPADGSFTLTHEVAATTPGATTYALSLRPGTQTSSFTATDLMTGAALEATVREIKGPGNGGSAVSSSLVVSLARPVPKDGQGRIRIAMDAMNPGMFTRTGDRVSFVLSAIPPRGTIVLPAGYELLSCDIPAQVLHEGDGRIAVSFMHQIPGEATLSITARAGIPAGPEAAPAPLTNARTWEDAPQNPTERSRLSERATQDRDIVYFLQSPETNAFSLYHDYTETRPGVDKYVNVVRTGARVSNPSAYILDTGEVLKHETLKGDAITAANISAGTVTPDTEVVVLHFPPVKDGQSVRLRISETYTTPESYRLDDRDLVFERNLGRARNSVVLPAGWYLTASAIPGVVREMPDGRIRLDFVNGRPGGIDVYLKGRKR